MNGKDKKESSITPPCSTGLNQTELRIDDDKGIIIKGCKMSGTKGMHEQTTCPFYPCKPLRERATFEIYGRKPRTQLPTDSIGDLKKYGYLFDDGGF